MIVANMVAHAYSPYTYIAKAGVTGAQGYPWLQNQCEASLCWMSSHLKA